MTRLEILEKVIAGFESQEWHPSKTDDDDTYFYHHPEGLRCAAGWLIPDELYNVRMEGQIFTLLDYVKLGFSKEEADYIEYLQGLHDGAVSPEGLKDVFMAHRKELMDEA
jgi:hypothetical protein